MTWRELFPLGALVKRSLVSDRGGPWMPDPDWWCLVSASCSAHQGSAERQRGPIWPSREKCLCILGYLVPEHLHGLAVSCLEPSFPCSQSSVSSQVGYMKVLHPSQQSAQPEAARGHCAPAPLTWALRGCSLFCSSWLYQQNGVNVSFCLEQDSLKGHLLLGGKGYLWFSYVTLPLGLLFLVQYLVGYIHTTFKKSNMWNSIVQISRCEGTASCLPISLSLRFISDDNWFQAGHMAAPNKKVVSQLPLRLSVVMWLCPGP